MPRGGYRPGAGRPPKEAALEPEAGTPGSPALSPLDYLLGVMNDATTAPERRDRAAIAAAPYVHGKVEKPGRKQARQQAAEDALSKPGRFRPGSPPRHLAPHARSGGPPGAPTRAEG